MAHVLRWEDLRTLLNEHPDWMLSLLQHLACQLRSMTERYAMRGEDLRRRVCGLLIVNLEETGDPVFGSTREELAGWVGAPREATSRMLKQLHSEGSIELGRGTVAVAVLDRNGLRG